MIPLSILDLAFINEGSVAAEALQRSADLAVHAEGLGFRRFWLAEHHAMPGIASAATAVAIGYVAGATKTIRVGAGGIMLPNHAPLAVAEAFGTLDSLYPGRIDLGLGRAPGSDQATMWALRRDPALPIVSLRMLRNCCIISRSPNRGRRFLLCRERGWMCPSGCSGPPCFLRIWPQSWACRLRLPVILHRI